MQKISKISALFLSISYLACILWMGSYLVRMFLTYQLFDETLSTYKSYVNEQNINGILITLNPSIVSTFILYIIFIVFFILFLLTAGLSLKQNGWLFIITILMIITLPFELYLMTIDFKIFMQVNSGIFRGSDIIVLIIKRFKILGSFPLIELLCYLAVIILAIFKPMTRDKALYEH